MFILSDHMLQCDPRVPILPIETNWKPNVEIAPNCPRCASPNTKFCYYNNYSLSQPRYFCKGCKRYWTKGGSLRNIPVGGGCRKSRRRGKSSREKRGQIVSNYSKNSSSGVSSSCSDGDSKNDQVPDIDLAVVFAKFLNHNASFDDDHHQPNDEDNNNRQKPVVHSIPESYNMLQESEAFELQNLLAGDDEMVLQDVLWADHDVAESTTPDFEWQSQQFELFPVDDDELKVSANLMNEDWGSFDLSGFGVFSKPSS